MNVFQARNLSVTTLLVWAVHEVRIIWCTCMNEIETTFNRIQSRFSQRNLGLNYNKPDYKKKLARATTASPAKEDPQGDDLDEIHVCTEQTTSALRTLAQCPETGSIAFQSVAVAAIRTLDRARVAVCEAGQAALSLGQQTKIKRIVGSLDSAAQTLEATLSDKGNRMLDLNACAPVTKNGEDTTWWFALTEAIQTVDAGIDWLTSLVSGQPDGAPTHMLGSLVSDFLRTHHDALLLEAETWMQG